MRVQATGGFFNGLRRVADGESFSTANGIVGRGRESLENMRRSPI